MKSKPLGFQIPLEIQKKIDELSKKNKQKRGKIVKEVIGEALFDREFNFKIKEKISLKQKVFFSIWADLEMIDYIQKLSNIYKVPKSCVIESILSIYLPK